MKSTELLTDTVKTFTCSNCSQKWEIKHLASTVPVYNSQPLKTCRKCYDFYHNPPPSPKPKEELFKCDFCRLEIIGTRIYRKVDVSMPNELGLIKGQFYNLCVSCSPRVKEYNEAEEDNKTNRQLEEWE